MTADFEQTALALSEQLHRALARNECQSCMVLVDTRLRPLEVDHPLVSLPVSHIPVAPSDPRVDVRLCPLLHPLDTGSAKQSLALQRCIDEALNELVPDALNSGAGRRIAAVLVSDAPPNDIARHLASHLVQRSPASSTARSVGTLLHFYDPAVIWWLWPLLTPAQQAALLGPVREWWLLNPLGHWVTLSTRASPNPEPHRLALTLEQWNDIRIIGALNAALRSYVSSEEGVEPHIDQIRQTALAASRRARATGWTEPSDIAAFVFKALTIAPDFDQHPRLAPLFAARASDDRFNSVVDKLTDADWQRVRSAIQPQGATKAVGEEALTGAGYRTSPFNRSLP